MKKQLILGLAILSTTLFSCGNKTDKIIVMPKGAPTLGLYQEIINEKVNVLDNAKSIKDLLFTNDYKYIVFDAYTAQNLINAGKCKNYTFAKLLTGGNFHLVGFDASKETPTDDDYIMGFGTNAMVPNKVYNYLYEDAKFDFSSDGIGVLQTKLSAMDENGKVDGIKVDWAFLAEPALLSLKNNNVNFKTLLAYDYNIKDVFKERTGMEYLMQAGLFVNKDYLKNHKDAHDSFMKRVDDQLKDALTNPNKVITSINSKFKTEDEQQKNFGFPSKIINALQKDNQNRFGIVNPDDKIGLEELKQFKNIIG